MKNLVAISGKIGSGKDTVGQIIQLLQVYNKNPDIIEKEQIWKENITVTLSRIFNDKILREHFCPYSDFKIKKFADKLKDTVCILIGCTREELEDRKFKNTPLGEEWWVYKTRCDTLVPYLESNGMRSEEDLIKTTPRILMQILGTEAGRKLISPNIWVNTLFADYRPSEFMRAKMRRHGRTIPLDIIRESYPSWIITDLRFPNEARAVKEKGGILIRVNPYYSEDFYERWWNNIDDEIKNHYLSEIEGHDIGLTLDDLSSWYEEINNTCHKSETALDDFKDWDYVIENDGSIADLVQKVINLNIV